MELIHYISEAEVHAAEQLARKGEQRLRAISPREVTSFKFPISCGDNFASAVIKISPVIHQTSQHPSYTATAKYESCFHSAEGVWLDREIQRVIQLIYDTYVQAIRWAFGEDCLEKCQSYTHAECSQRRYLYLGRMERRWGSEAVAEAENPLLSNQRGAHSFANAPSPPLLAVTSANERDGNNQEDAHQQEEASLQAYESKAQRASRPSTEAENSCTERLKTEDERMAQDLIERAQAGLEGIEKWERKDFHLADIQALFSNSEAAKIDDLLSRMEKEYLKYAKAAKVELRITAWMYWWISASIRVALDSRRRRKQHRRASAAFILYSILNQLLVTEGIQALSLIFAYAYKNCCFSDAAATSRPRQVEISRLVATGLQGKLKSLKAGFFFPIPAVWVAFVTGSCYYDACCTLGAPNLSVLDLEPGWIRWKEKDYHLGTEICYSVLKQRWDMFLRWADSHTQMEFSWLVSQWCRLRRAQEKPPTVSVVDESSTGNPPSSWASSYLSPTQGTGPDSVDRHLDCLSTTAQNAWHYEDGDNPTEPNQGEQHDGLRRFTRPRPSLLPSSTRPSIYEAPTSSITRLETGDVAGSTEILVATALEDLRNPTLVNGAAAGSALGKRVSQADNITENSLQQGISYSTLNQVRKRQRLDCDAWTEPESNEAHTSAIRLLDALVPETAFPHTMPYIAQAVTPTNQQTGTVVLSTDWSPPSALEVPGATSEVHQPELCSIQSWPSGYLSSSGVNVTTPDGWTDMDQAWTWFDNDLCDMGFPQ